MYDPVKKPIRCRRAEYCLAVVYQREGYIRVPKRISGDDIRHMCKFSAVAFEVLLPRRRIVE